MVKKGSHFIKSFTASTFLMFIISLLSLALNSTEYMQIVTNQRILILMVILTALMSAINVYLSKRY